MEKTRIIRAKGFMGYSFRLGHIEYLTPCHPINAQIVMMLRQA